MPIPELESVPMPAFIAMLPRDDRGYPIPYFSAVQNGKAVIGVVDLAKINSSFRFRRCFICGQPLTQAPVGVVIGAIGALNRITNEPSSHLACCEYAIRACPFLARGEMKALSHREGTITPDTLIDIKSPVHAIVYIEMLTTYPKVIDIATPLFTWPGERKVTWWRDGKMLGNTEARRVVTKHVVAYAETLGKRDGIDALKTWRARIDQLFCVASAKAPRI